MQRAAEGSKTPLRRENSWASCCKVRRASVLPRCTWFAVVGPSAPLRMTVCGLGPTPHQQRQLPPLPMAIHIHKSNFPQPLKLRFEIQQLVRGIFGFARFADVRQELFVQFAIKFALPLVDEMMNREAGNDGVELAQLR